MGTRARPGRLALTVGTALDGSGSTTVGSTTVMWTPNSRTNNEWTITGA
ncbi:hypothetical protein [Streptomyces sp. NPDC021212]